MSSPEGQAPKLTPRLLHCQRHTKAMEIVIPEVMLYRRWLPEKGNSQIMQFYKIFTVLFLIAMFVFILSAALHKTKDDLFFLLLTSLALATGIGAVLNGVILMTYYEDLESARLIKKHASTIYAVETDENISENGSIHFPVFFYDSKYEPIALNYAYVDKNTDRIMVKITSETVNVIVPEHLVNYFHLQKWKLPVSKTNAEYQPKDCFSLTWFPQA